MDPKSSLLVIDGVHVYQVGDEFCLDPFEAALTTQETLQAIAAWCSEHSLLPAVLDVFEHSGCRFNPQFISLEDLNLLIEHLPSNNPISLLALKEKEQFMASLRSTALGCADACSALVYFLQGEGGVKIGMTSNLSSRLQALCPKTSSLSLRVLFTIKTQYPSQLEQWFHAYFLHKRAELEWFKLDSTDLQAAIALAHLVGLETEFYDSSLEPRNSERA